MTSLRALLQEAVDCTTIGPVEWYVPVENGPRFRRWLTESQTALATSTQQCGASAGRVRCPHPARWRCLLLKVYRGARPVASWTKRCDHHVISTHAQPELL